MEIQTYRDAHEMLGQVMRNLRLLQDSIIQNAGNDAKLVDEYFCCTNHMYTMLSEISDFIIDPDAENADAGNHITE